MNTEMIVTYPADAPDMSAAIEPFVMSKDKPKSFTKPAVEELYVQDGKWQFTVTFKGATKLSSIWKRFYLKRDKGEVYDSSEALNKASQSSSYVDAMTGVYVSNPLQECFPDDIEPLPADVVEKRVVSFVTLCNQCVQPDIVQKIMGAVQRKKDGRLYKGRVLHLNYLRLVDEMGTTFALVAKNEDDLRLCIELRSNVPVNDDLRFQSYLF